MALSRIKLENKLLSVYAGASYAAEKADSLRMAERIAPVNVHSHGVLIANMIDELEKALRDAKAYQLEVQGR